MIKMDNPIIIVGTGRCGSTMLHRILARHDDLGWLSTFNEVFPTQQWLSLFSNLYSKEIFNNKVKHLSFFPKPFESYKFWEHYLPGFTRRDKPLTAEDVPENGISPVRSAIKKVLKYQNKERFLIKVTGWSRIAYFNKIFPEAKFVFLNREHRSIVSSWVQAGWLDVTTEVDSSEWQWGEVPAKYRSAWEDLGGGSVLSAAVKIQIDLDDIHKNIEMFKDRCYEIQYENLITEPISCLQDLFKFCGLRWYQKFEDKINAMTFYNPVNKWKKYLSDKEGELILEFFARAQNAQ